MGAGASKKANPGLAELVAAADTDKDGIISVEELDAMLQEAGIDWPRKRKDGNGKVDLAEFVKGTEQLLAVLEKLHPNPYWRRAARGQARRSITQGITTHEDREVPLCRAGGLFRRPCTPVDTGHAAARAHTPRDTVPYTVLAAHEI